MPDTGAPWNIPYVEAADLVRDWPADSLLVANAVAAGLSAAGNPGIGSNVVQTFKADVFSTSSATLVDVTGLAVTITPSSDTSKVLVIVDVPLSDTGDAVVRMQLVRGSTNIYVPTGGTSRNTTGYSFGTSNNVFDLTKVFLDSPNVATAVTYKVQVSVTAGTVFVNRRAAADADGIPATITAIEVAA